MSVKLQWYMSLLLTWNKQAGLVGMVITMINGDYRLGCPEIQTCSHTHRHTHKVIGAMDQYKLAGVIIGSKPYCAYTV